MTLIWLAEIVVYDPSAPGLITLRYSSGTGFNTGPSDTPARTPYLPYMNQPALLKTDVIPCLREGGGTPQFSIGELVLVNAGGRLNALKNYAFGGHTAMLRVGDDANLYNDTNFPVVFAGTMDTVNIGIRKLTIRFKTPTVSPSRRVCKNVYDGSGGLEGTANMQGKAKPRAFGVCPNALIPQIDPSLLIYQAADFTNETFYTGGAGCDVTDVYDAAVVLTPGAPYATEADLLDVGLPPAAGEYRVFISLDGTWVRLGSNPVGDVTADLESNWINYGAGTPAYGMVSLASVGMLMLTDAIGTRLGSSFPNDAAAARCGHFVNDLSTTVEQFIATILAGSMGWYGTKVLFTGQLLAFFDCLPGYFTTTPFPTFETASILDLERIGNAGDLTEGVPCWRLVYEYSRNFTVQTGTQVGGSVTQARRDYLAHEFRTIVKEDTAVLTAYPAATTVTIRSVISDDTIADVEADRLFTLLSERRSWVRAVVRVPQGTFPTQDYPAISTKVILKTPWLYMNDPDNTGAGTTGTIVTSSVDQRRGRAELLLYCETDGY